MQVAYAVEACTSAWRLRFLIITPAVDMGCASRRASGASEAPTKTQTGLSMSMSMLPRNIMSADVQAHIVKAAQAGHQPTRGLLDPKLLQMWQIEDSPVVIMRSSILPSMQFETALKRKAFPEREWKLCIASNTQLRRQP